MILRVEDFDDVDELTRVELLVKLKKEAKNIHIKDIMNACNFLLEEGKYVQSSYREKFHNAYLKSFILRIKEVKDDKCTIQQLVDMGELKKSLKLMEEQENDLLRNQPHDPNFSKIYQIISIYTTFVLEEPIHVVGSEFPGGFKVKFENKTYYCPVKDKQQDNPGAVCGFCIAEQDPDVV
ncbi:MAG: DUF2115 domain-containing protein [Methanobacterium sp. ERen5]|nr:MAG: DUF2115 domain-containing protein [Methanobacterium sp. ERen5]